MESSQPFAAYLLAGAIWWIARARREHLSNFGRKRIGWALFLNVAFWPIALILALRWDEPN